MSNITITINCISHTLSQTNNQYLYNQVKIYHEMMTGKIINIRIVTIDGIVQNFKVISNEPLLKQVKKFPTDKYKVMYDGISIKENDTTTNLNMCENDIMDAIRI